MLRIGRRTTPPPQAETRQQSVIAWESGHVRAAVLRLGEDTAEMLGVAAAPVHGIGDTSLPDVDRWFTSADRALTQAEDMSAQSGGKRVIPDRVTMCVPTAVTRDIFITVAERRRNPTRSVTLDELRGVLKRGYRSAQDALVTKGQPAPGEIVFGSVSRVNVDGQMVADPLALYGESIELQMCFTVVPSEWIRALEAVADRLALQLSAIVPHHAAYASPITEPLAMMILLEEGHSLIGLVRRGRLEWEARSEIGERELVQGTTRGLSLDERQQDTLMRAYRAGQLRSEFEQELALAFWSELRRWMTDLAEQALAFTEPRTFVPRLYVGDITRNMPEAVMALETPFWEKCLPFGGCPVVLEMGVSGVRDVLDWTAQANGPSFLLLRSLGHYVARTLGPDGALDRALNETIQWRRTPLHPLRRSR